MIEGVIGATVLHKRASLSLMVACRGAVWFYYFRHFVFFFSYTDVDMHIKVTKQHDGCVLPARTPQGSVQFANNALDL